MGKEGLNMISGLIASATLNPNSEKETRLFSKNCDYMGSIYEQIIFCYERS
jgi:hypothetical protein